MTDEAQAVIEIWTQAPQLEVKPALPALRKVAQLDVNQVKVSDLAENLGELLVQVQSAFDKAQQVTSSFTVDEVELNIGINAKGGLALIGKVEAGMEAGIKVKLKKRNA